MRGLRSRLIRLVPVLVIVTFATFSMVRLLPGDPARSFLGPEAPEEQVEHLRDEMGLDEPILVSYLAWLGRVVQGDLGESYRTGQSVTEALGQRFPVSLELMFLAQVFALVLAIPVGVLTAYRAGSVLDRLWSATAFATIAVPGFVLGLLLIYLFPVRLGWLQISGYTRLTADPWGNLRSLVLPAATLGLLQVAVYSRILRSDMVATLQEDFVVLARSKGVSTPRILFGHALRPSSFSLLTLAGLNVGQLISGAVIVEYLFGLPGIGLLLIDSILSRDLMMLQGAMLFIVVGYVLVNLVVDTLYEVLDPRTRHHADV
ncbi:MAG: ABC transporter permease [Acidimicrobiia bacterium]|nr:ABC transporter permease [Acidimicrobiia bacterium]